MVVIYKGWDFFRLHTSLEAPGLLKGTGKKSQYYTISEKQPDATGQRGLGDWENFPVLGGKIPTEKFENQMNLKRGGPGDNSSSFPGQSSIAAQVSA